MFPPVAERTPVSPFLASAGLRLAPIGWEPSYHSIDTVTDKSCRGNQPELRPSARQLNGNFRIADNLATRDSFPITNAFGTNPTGELITSRFPVTRPQSRATKNGHSFQFRQADIAAHLDENRVYSVPV